MEKIEWRALTLMDGDKHSPHPVFVANHEKSIDLAARRAAEGQENRISSAKHIVSSPLAVLA